MTLPADMKKNNSDIAQFFEKGDEITVNGEKSTWLNCNVGYLTLRVGEQEKRLKWTDITDVSELGAKRKLFAQEFQKLLALGWTLVKREHADPQESGLPQPLLVEFGPASGWMNYYNYGYIEPYNQAATYLWAPTGDLTKLPPHADCFLIRRAIEGQKNDETPQEILNKLHQSVEEVRIEQMNQYKHQQSLSKGLDALQFAPSISDYAGVPEMSGATETAPVQPPSPEDSTRTMSWHATRRVYCYSAPGTSRPDYLEGPDAHKEVLKAILANEYCDDEWAVSLSSTGQIVINQLPV